MTRSYDGRVLIGTIRPTETRRLDVEADSLAGIHEALTAACPGGFELTDAPVRMSKGTTRITATGTFARRDGSRDIEADDMPALRGKVPEGHLLVSVGAV